MQEAISNETAQKVSNSALAGKKLNQEDADKIVKAVLMYAINSDKEIPLSQEALVGFAEGLALAVITVRNCS